MHRTADIQKRPHQFLPANFELTQWESLEPYFKALLDREITNKLTLESWMQDLSELEAFVSEDACWRQIKMTCDTTDKSLEAAFTFFCMEIQPKIQPYADALNKKLAPFVIFKSIESDILNDGSLDYPDEILALFDIVIASVHSNLKMTEEKAMMRLMNAIENPYTSILGHPTGRLLLSRKGYPINHQEIIMACAANNVVIELNAHPRRLDMDWRYIHQAMKEDVLISINPDAHAIDGFEDCGYGVLVAQKAGLTAAQNLSSFSLAEMMEFISYQQAKRD